MAHVRAVGILRSAEAANTWTRELFGRILGSDAEFGTYNQQLMAWWTQRWLPRAVDAVAAISTLFDSTDTLRSNNVGSPRQIFEVLATDWVRDVAPVWGSDVTAEDLLSRYDKSAAAGGPE